MGGAIPNSRRMAHSSLLYLSKQCSRSAIVRPLCERIDVSSIDVCGDRRGKRRWGESQKAHLLKRPDSRYWSVDLTELRKAFFGTLLKWAGSYLASLWSEEFAEEC